MKKLKKSTAVSAVQVINEVLGNKSLISDGAADDIKRTRTDLAKWYREYVRVNDKSDKAYDEEFAQSFNNNSTYLQKAYARLQDARNEYDKLFADEINVTSCIKAAVQYVSETSGYEWFSVEYLEDNGYSFAPQTSVTTDASVISYVAKLYATALADKKEIAYINSEVEQYTTSIVGRIDQLESWNVAITQDIIDSIVTDTLKNEEDANIINTLKARVSKLAKKYLK